MTWPGAGAADRRASQRGLAAGGAIADRASERAASGARQLVDAAVRALAARRGRARAATVARSIAGSLDELARALGAGARIGDEPARRWLDRVARAVARATPRSRSFELGDDPRAAELDRARSHAPSGPRAVVAIVDTAPPPRDGVDVHVAPLLDVDGVPRLAASMIGSEPPRAWVAAPARGVSGGLALDGDRAAAIDRARAGAVRDRMGGAIDGRRGRAARRASCARSSPGARRLAVAIAVWGGRARLDRALATVAAASAADRSASPRSSSSSAPGSSAGAATSSSIDRATADAAERRAATAPLVALAAGRARASAGRRRDARRGRGAARARAARRRARASARATSPSSCSRAGAADRARVLADARDRASRRRARV